MLLIYVYTYIVGKKWLKNKVNSVIIKGSSSFSNMNNERSRNSQKQSVLSLDN